MDCVVVLEPGRQLLEDGGGVRPGTHPGIAALEGFDESLADAVAFGAANRREAQHEVERGGEVGRLGSGVGKLLSASHWRAADGVEPTLYAVQHKSRVISPEMPPLEMATKVMISWSWVSMTKATRTTSPF